MNKMVYIWLVNHVNCCAYNDIQTNLFTSARSIHPNFNNLTDDGKLSLILANADMVYRYFWTFNIYMFLSIISHTYFNHYVSYSKI